MTKSWYSTCPSKRTFQAWRILTKNTRCSTVHAILIIASLCHCHEEQNILSALLNADTSNTVIFSMYRGDHTRLKLSSLFGKTLYIHSLYISQPCCPEDQSRNEEGRQFCRILISSSSFSTFFFSVSTRIILRSFVFHHPALTKVTFVHPICSKRR